MDKIAEQTSVRANIKQLSQTSVSKKMKNIMHFLNKKEETHI